MRRIDAALATLLLVLSTVVLSPAAGGPPEDAPTNAPPEAELRGTVFDPQGKPLAGATVRVRRQYTVEDRRPGAVRADSAAFWRTTVVETSETGEFLASGLRGRRFAVRAESAGLAPATEEGVRPDANLKIRLQPGQALAGRVLDQQSGAPIAGAEVRLCDEPALIFGREACRGVATDDEGAFRTEGLARQEHGLEAVAPAHALLLERDVAVPQDVDPETDEPRRLELFLGPGARVAGEVRSGDDEPVQDARVILAPRSDARAELRVPPRVTDGDGRFDFPGAPAGKYELQILARGLPQPKPLPIEVVAGEDRVDVVVRLSAGATLKLRLVDPDDEPVSDLEFRVVATRFDGGRSIVSVDPSQVEAGTDGRYTIRSLPPGRYEFEFDAVGWRDLIREDVAIREGETTDLGTLSLEEGGAISGTVTDDAGNPVANAHVHATWRAPDSRRLEKHTRSAEDGTYRLAGLEYEGLLETVKVQLPEYAPASKRSVAIGEEGVDFVLQRTGGVRGVVLLPDGRPATAFRIETEPEADGTGNQDPEQVARRALGMTGPGRSFGDAEGRFELKALRPGRYTITARAPGVAPANRAGVTVRGGEITDVGRLTLREGIEVRGRVLSMDDDSPVPGVVLSVFLPGRIDVGVARRPLATARSGSEGRFVFEGLDAGSFSVITEHPDYSPAETRIRLEEGLEPPELVLRLGRGGGIRGTVRDEEGRPWAGARILVGEGSVSRQSGSTVADADGAYSFEKLEPGEYVVALVAGGGAGGMRTKKTTVVANETSIVNFGEEARIRLRGRLLRAGRVLEGWVLLFTLEGESRTTRTEAEGIFEVSLERPGNYQVAVSSESTGVSTPAKIVPLDVPDQPEVYREIEIEGSSIRGLVQDVEARPVIDAMVTAVATGGPGAAASPAVSGTDAEGHYELVGVEAGLYRLVVRAAGFATAERSSVVVEEGVDLREDFTLEEGGRIRGRVVGSEGRGLAGAWILPARAGANEIDPLSRTTSDANGRFDISTGDDAVDLHVLATGWAPGRAAGVRASPDPAGREVTITLRRGGELRVRVLGPEEEPISGARVALRPLEPSPGTILALAFRPAPTTDATGETRIDSLAPGAYEVSFAGRSDVTPVQVEVAAGAVASVSLIVPAPR